MRASLVRWIADADALKQLEQFSLVQSSLELATIQTRPDDFYISLVSELFDQLKASVSEPADWARLGNAFWQFSTAEGPLNAEKLGISRFEAALFASCAFYFGGFPASAYLVQRESGNPSEPTKPEIRCRELLLRPAELKSHTCAALIDALLNGDMHFIATSVEEARADTLRALRSSPQEWIIAALFEKLLERFSRTNVRAVLPSGEDPVWTPLIESFISRRPPTWDYFPSQIQAIEAGLITRNENFALQMPTGAGKTTLCETLLYAHTRRDQNNVAVLLVPYRALASELKGSLVRRLNNLGISARCAYGGSVPGTDELHDLDATRVLVATPEALSGTLSAEPLFFNSISLVICDEGHLLDNGDRGIGLELLLARMRSRPSGPPRIVFVSAIVPNIEEINAWLGGTPDSVVRSEYRPAIAEYAVLRPQGTPLRAVNLDMHPQAAPPERYLISPFLKKEDFRWLRPETGKFNTYSFASVKTQAIAAARKVISMGAVAVFAAQKRGHQGAIGLAEELQIQMQLGISLPDPRSFSNPEMVDEAVRYLSAEYGDDWIGTRTLANAAILHHGDIPQETREVLEHLLRSGAVRLAICTSTLAEGVNLPIRTLILYSVQRRSGAGAFENLLARDIKNLAGRAGRPGASTKGLVICANPGQWPIVKDVALQMPGEPVTGELRRLVEAVQDRLAMTDLTLTNDLLERSPALHSLIDGIDSTLIDLAAEEIGEQQLVAIATQLADRTFASQQAQLEASKALLRSIFDLRARRVIEARSNGRINWVRETGARIRFLEPVEGDLSVRRDRWDDLESPTDPALVGLLVDWAWRQPEMPAAVAQGLGLSEPPSDSHKSLFLALVAAWLSGARYKEMSSASGLQLDRMLGLHTNAVMFVFHSLVEQAIALLQKVVESKGATLSKAVASFPDHLRFGVPSTSALVLARRLRHRSAAVELGAEVKVEEPFTIDDIDVETFARQMMADQEDEWRTRLGALVFGNTVRDLAIQ